MVRAEIPGPDDAGLVSGPTTYQSMSRANHPTYASFDPLKYKVGLVTVVIYSITVSNK